MKKTPALMLLSGLAAVLGLSLAPKNMHLGDAYFVKSAEFYDDFDGNSIKPEWTTSNDASLSNDYSSLKLEPQAYEWGGHVLLTEYEIEKTVKITYDIQDLGCNGWFGFSYGNPNKTSPFHESNAAFIFANDTILYFDHVDKDIVDDTGIRFPFSFITGTSHLRRTVEVTLERQPNKTYIGGIKIFEMSGSLVGQQDNIEMPCVDGYIGFNSNFTNAEIFSIKIENENGGVEYYDDFSTSECSYLTKTVAGSEWNSVSFNETELKLGKKNKLNLANVDSYATYGESYSKPSNNDLDNLYTLSADIFLGSLDIGLETGIEIGKKTPSSKGYFLGLRKRTFGYALVVYEPDSETETSIACPEETSDMIISLTVEVFSDGSVIASTPHVRDVSKVENVEGYFGVATRNHNSGTGSRGGMINTFSYNKSSYRERIQEDISINFNGTKEEVDEGYTYYDFYYNKEFWFTGDTIKQSMYKTGQTDGYLTFSSASPTACFGPKVKISEAIVRFDIEMISSPETLIDGACLGLQFGKQNIGSLFENVPSLGLAYYPDPSNGEVYCTNAFKTNCEYAEGYDGIIKDSTGKSFNMFEKGNKYTFLYIIRNGTISMAFKSSEEDEKVLLTPRAVVALEDTDGYMTIFGANGISFMLDNVSYVNLDHALPTGSSVSVDGYQSTTRYDFRKDKDFSGLLLDNASIKNNAMRISEGGSIKTQNNVASNILRFQTENIENTLRVNQGNLKIDLVCDSSNKITVKDLSHSYTLDLGNNFNFNGANFEIVTFGNKLEISYSSGGLPLARMYRNTVTYEIDPVTTFDKLALTSINGISSIYSISLFNLDSHCYIETRNYNPETDEINPWPERESIPVIKYGGCGGSLMSTSILITVLSISLFTVLVILRKKED